MQDFHLSLHCWQADDVTGFEVQAGSLTGGIQATGNYPGKARNIDELRADILKAASYIPGTHRLNLHEIYGDFQGKVVDRDQVEPEHFKSWIEWGKEHNMKLDFNSTSFSHPKSGDLSLSNPDEGIRQFWIEHTKRCRAVAEEMGKAQGDPCIMNLWVHDGSKDITVNRMKYRALLKDSLDQIFATEYKNINLFIGIRKSIKVAVPSTLLCAYFSAMTAYALAMYKFKGNKVLFMTILIFMMIPGQLGLIGFYNLCTKLHLVNSYIPLIIPAIASPGTVFFLRQYVLSVMPPSLIEAARIDGASELYTFHRIAIPIMSPGIATMSIMGFIGGWNAYLLPMIILNKNEKFTLPVMMATLRASTDITANQGAIYLAVAISVIPILLVFAFFSKYIISSISAGAVKE